MSNITLSPQLQDYLETILILKEEKNVVRIKDIARRMKVANPSVVSAVKKLQAKGFIEHEHYGYVEFTEKGRSVAENIYKRHKILYAFFHEILHLPPGIAEKDACALEHYISEEGLDRIIEFISFFKDMPMCKRFMKDTKTK